MDKNDPVFRLALQTDADGNRRSLPDDISIPGVSQYIVEWYFPPTKLVTLYTDINSVASSEQVDLGEIHDQMRGMIIALLAAAKNARLELNQMHSHYVPDCEGGCPTRAYIEQLDEAILMAEAAGFHAKSIGCDWSPE